MVITIDYGNFERTGIIMLRTTPKQHKLLGRNPKINDIKSQNHEIYQSHFFASLKFSFPSLHSTQLNPIQLSN